MDTIYAVFGPGWFVEVRDASQANLIKKLLTDAGEEAHIRQSLPAAYALVVEYYPKMAGKRNRAPQVRRHKWAYGGWVKGPPAQMNPLTGDMPELFQMGREYQATGAIARYKNEAQLTADEQVKFLEAGAVTQPKHVNQATGQPTIFADSAFFQ